MVGLPVAGYREGASALPSFYPTTRQAVLLSAAAASGVPAPPSTNLASYVAPMTANTVPLVPINPIRSLLLIYNPTQAPAQFSKATASYGAFTNLSIGPGEAYFWADAQGLQPVYQGALTAIGQPGTFLWAWEDNSQLIVTLEDDFGILQLSSHTSGLPFPTSPIGQPVGAVWDNGLAVSVVPGSTPDPSAPPVFFGSITAASLLALGGGDLPTTRPNVTNQLWNNGGLVCVDTLVTPLHFAIGFGRIGTDSIG